MEKKEKKRKKNGALSFLLTRFKGAGEESHGRRGAGARAARVFSRLSDDKEGGGGGGGGPPRFPARGHRTIIFPLPSGDIALFPSIKCPPPLYTLHYQ